MPKGFRLTHNNLLDVAANSLYNHGDYSEFWEFVGKAQQSGFLSKKITTRWLDENEREIWRRESILEDSSGKVEFEDRSPRDRSKRT